MKFERLAGADH
jgi:hypothetical protein